MRRKNLRETSVNILEVYDDEMGYIPPDITRMDDASLRAAHAYWVACNTRTLAVLSRIQQKIKELKRFREVRFKTLFLQFKDERQSNEVARYNAELDAAVVEVDDAIMKLEKHELRYDSMSQQCEQYRFLLSREQSWREKEKDVYYKKGGQGR